MTLRQGARLALRAATAPAHDGVDRAFAGFDLGERHSYAAFLAAQAAAFVPVEAAVDRSAIATVLPDWPARRRVDALAADLAALGHAGPLALDPPVYASVEAALGAVYVLEGSRLGGRMLARSVAAGLPRRFLGAGDSAMWRTFIGVLDATLISDRQLTGAIEAARAVFARFEAAARCHLKDGEL